MEETSPHLSNGTLHVSLCLSPRGEAGEAKPLTCLSSCISTRFQPPGETNKLARDSLGSCCCCHTQGRGFGVFVNWGLVFRLIWEVFLGNPHGLSGWEQQKSKRQSREGPPYRPEYEEVRGEARTLRLSGAVVL